MDKTRRKLKPIARKRRNFLYLLLAILFAIITGYLLFSFSPEYKLKVLSLSIPIIPIFFLSLFIFTYSILRFIFINAAQTAIISILFFAYLISRLGGLTHWIFAALFLSLFITIQLFMIKKK